MGWNVLPLKSIYERFIPLNSRYIHFRFIPQNKRIGGSLTFAMKKVCDSSFDVL